MNMHPFIFRLNILVASLLIRCAGRISPVPGGIRIWGANRVANGLRNRALRMTRHPRPPTDVTPRKG